ncbi:MAG: hypothetical protein HY376_03570 [Candidatus Blackburnbacteria bacterium]|nr:hypothetical protein [Candidatus Blackburnbacteria bacterium]
MGDNTDLQEGTLLLMQSIAETLQKMNERLELADMEDEEESEEEQQAREEEEAKKEKEEMMKSMIEAVVKQITDRGADKTRDVSGQTKWPMERNTTVQERELPSKAEHSTKPGSEQSPIQGQDMGAHKDEVEDKKLHEEMHEKEKEDKNDEEYPKVEAMRKENEDLRKQLDDLKKSIASLDVKKSDDEKINERVRAELLKHGFKEERSTSQRVVPATLPKEEVPIMKSAEGNLTEDELIDQLAKKVDRRTLINWKMQLESGRTDGVPAEVVAHWRK